jgi:GT2 family glycosyltransferase
MKSVCLAILNYNGRSHLEVLLPSALEAARQYPGEASVLVLDNCSTDNDLEWIISVYPAVKAFTSPKNDFLFSYNWLLPQLHEEIVVILNNDLKLDTYFINHLLKHFRSLDIFAVSASSYDWEGKERTIGPSRLTYRNGMYGWRFDKEHQEPCYTLFASGGFMAVDRRKFVELGGFNRLYYPAYCEDLDLGFRAWRRGWKSIYEPKSIVYHRETASWNESPISSPSRLNLRNSLLFQWSSLPMSQDSLKRYWSLFKLCISGLIHRDNAWPKIFPSTWLYWLSIRHNYTSQKASFDEINSITLQINTPIAE